jgi:DNA repair protein RadC
MRKLTQIPAHDRPREKMIDRGPAALSDLELLAILLGSGNKSVDVMTLANRVLNVLDSKGVNPDLKTLCDIDGMGPAKAAIVAAAMELARRRIRPEGVKISQPPDIMPLIRHMADRKQEHFLCISLNGANEVIASRTVSVGLVNTTQVHPREVFADPITDRASAVIVAHNHPSGNLDPSREDMAITQKLKAAGETLGIQLLDHIIFSKKGYYSFKEYGNL